MVLQIKTKIDDTNPVHVYYDIDIMNNDQKNGEPAQRLVYTSQRSSPFLNCPSLYYASITRFNLQTPSLPVFIPQVVVGQSDPNLLIYKFYLVFGNQHISNNVAYIASDTTILPPAPPIIAQDLSSSYYFVYTVQHWIEMLNTALKYLAIGLNLDIPFFQFDVQTSLLKLYIPFNYYTAGIKLYVNKQLQTLLDSFDMQFEQSLFFGNLHFFKILPNHFNQKTINNLPYIVLEQESTTICLLNPIKSIVFSTSLLPLRNTLTQPSQIFGSDATLFNNGNNANILPIITDFEVNVSNTNTYKEQIQYNNTGEYRLIDLFGETPCSSISITVYWKDHFGNLHDFVLNSGCSCDIKMLFRRKDFGNMVIE